MKKFLALLLATLLVLPLCGCAALYDRLPDEIKAYLVQLHIYDDPADGDGGPDLPPYREDTNSYGYYYDQLPEDCQVIYRSIYLDSKNTEGITIVFREPLCYTAHQGGDAAADEAVRQGIRTLVQPALDALLYDHPEIFWLSMDPESGSTFRIASRKESLADGSTTATVRTLTFQLVLRPGITVETITEEEARLSAAKEEAGQAFSESADRYTKAKALHDYLCRSVIYDLEATRAHDMTGALLDGYAVCDGYAKAFQYLCMAYDIPCLTVPGSATQNGRAEPHAWNYVQMEDGAWYAVDVTWDDGSGQIRYHYFLVGAGTVTSAQLGRFDTSHHTNGKFSAGEYEPFSFPVLSEQRYQAKQLMPA